MKAAPRNSYSCIYKGHVVTWEKKNFTVSFGKCGPCPVFASYTLAFTLQLRKKHGKTSVRVVEKCPEVEK
jgi:hypothetical protein